MFFQYNDMQARTDQKDNWDKLPKVTFQYNTSNDEVELATKELNVPYLPFHSKRRGTSIIW